MKSRFRYDEEPIEGCFPWSIMKGAVEQIPTHGCGTKVSSPSLIKRHLEVVFYTWALNTDDSAVPGLEAKMPETKVLILFENFYLLFENF